MEHAKVKGKEYLHFLTLKTWICNSDGPAEYKLPKKKQIGYAYFKIQTSLFSHSGFMGKMCKIASGIPDFLHT